jgi:hypothetical protein
MAQGAGLHARLGCDSSNSAGAQVPDLIIFDQEAFTAQVCRRFLAATRKKPAVNKDVVHRVWKEAA